MYGNCNNICTGRSNGRIFLGAICSGCCRFGDVMDRLILTDTAVECVCRQAHSTHKVSARNILRFTFPIELSELRPVDRDLSFLLSFLGQPGCYLVMWQLAEMIGKENDAMCSALKICTFLGCYTGLITHAVFCIKPLVYKHIFQEASLKAAENALHETDKLTILPVLVCSVTLIMIPAFLISAAIWQGILPVSRLWIIFNPIFLMIAMLAVKKAFPKLPMIGFMGTGFIVYAAMLLVIAR